MSQHQFKDLSDEQRATLIEFSKANQSLMEYVKKMGEALEEMQTVINRYLAAHPPKGN